MRCAGVDIRRRLVKDRRLLIEFIECEYGLIDELMSLEVFNVRQLTDLKSHHANLHKQNEVLLDLLCDTDIVSEPFQELTDFITALRSTHQHHIATYLQSMYRNIFV